jgi:hypothetical protein
MAVTKTDVPILVAYTKNIANIPSGDAYKFQKFTGGAWVDIAETEITVTASRKANLIASFDGYLQAA